RPPLREPGAELAVLVQPLAQTVESLRDLLPGGVRQLLRALVDLDPRDDPLLREQLRERRPVRRALPDRLVVEDDAADVVAGAFGREEHVAVGAPTLLGRLDPDRVEPLLDRAVALVGGEDALPRRDERARGLFQAVSHLRSSSSLSPGLSRLGSAVSILFGGRRGHARAGILR